MKIIQKGILPQSIIYTGTCINCKAQVECNSTEVLYTLFGESVPCPTEGCGRSIVLVNKSAPSSERSAEIESLLNDILEAEKYYSGKTSGQTVPAEKHQCNCGVHRISELSKKKLSPTHEKTLDELISEL